MTVLRILVRPAAARGFSPARGEARAVLSPKGERRYLTNNKNN